eukprot:4369803-Lingulodinium_polyedra.AAC.1
MFGQLPRPASGTVLQSLCRVNDKRSMTSRTTPSGSENANGRRGPSKWHLAGFTTINGAATRLKLTAPGRLLHTA